MRILGVCGSLQANSANLSLLESAAASAPKSVKLIIYDGIRHLPHFNPDLAVVETPGPVADWQQALASSDALLIASPEYGFSLPGSLKNAIDWVIGSGELERKVIAVTASTGGPQRGRRGLNALCGTLEAVSARIVGGEPIVRGPTFDAEVAQLVKRLVETAFEA